MATEWESVYFLSHVNIKNIIGKELINDDNVAILELVKNSYDAGATEVTVEFKNMSNKNIESHEIIIVDNGIGMSKNDILQKWLNLAYSIKRELYRQNKRVQAGNKGIGRFSCDRLGKQLDIYTKKLDGNIYHLKIDWNDFENKNNFNTQIQDIPLKLRIIDNKLLKLETNLSLTNQGSIVLISNLNERWLKIENNEDLFNPRTIDKIKILRLKFALEKLINKNQVNDNNFKIIIKTDGIDNEDELSYHQKINGELKNKFFDRFTFNTTYINSVITPDGKEIITKIRDRGKTIFKTIEKNVEFPLLKGVKIVLMYLNPYGKQYFNDFMGMRSVEFGSIFLFINGFRIPPYGDSDKDSLGLEVRKTQGRSRYISNREIVGRIEINDVENRFGIISSREGIVKNEAYLQLIEKSINNKNSKNNGFFYKTHKKLEQYVVNGLKWDSVDTKLYPESKIQEMIHENNWNESKEIYKISRTEKLKNISKNIFQILKLDYKNIIDIYFDKKILLSLIEEKELDTEKNIIKFLKGFSKIPTNSVDLESKKNIEILQKSIKNRILSKKLEFLNKNKNIVINEYINKKEHYDLLDQKIKILEEKQDKLNKNLKKTVDEKELFRKQKEQNQKQVTQLKTILSKDTKELIAFQHHIGLYANTAKDYVLDTINQVKDSDFNKLQYLENLQIIVLELEKIKIISKYITREDYLSSEKKVNDDLVKFIFNYTKSIYESTTNKEFKININTNDIKHICKFEPIKINIIIDNLLSNSKKEEINSKNIKINFYYNKNILFMEYSDDGKGLDDSIVNPDSIFDIGVTTTTGSGLGLYHVKELLSEMKSSITVEKQNKGIKFLIRFDI